MYACMYLCVHDCMHVYAYECMYVYMYVCVCKFVCVTVQCIFNVITHPPFHLISFHCIKHSMKCQQPNVHTVSSKCLLLFYSMYSAIIVIWN